MGMSCTDQFDIANHFNEYFVNVGPMLAKKFDNCSTNYMRHLRGNYMNSMFLNDISVNEVAREITNLN